MSKWLPIETVQPDQFALFWIVAKTGDETYTDTDGNPIVATHFVPRIEYTKFGRWSSLVKATHWCPVPPPPRPELETSPVRTDCDSCGATDGMHSEDCENMKCETCGSADCEGCLRGLVVNTSAKPSAGAPDCEKCGGAGWLRGKELDSPDEATYADSMTKYPCDGEKCVTLQDCRCKRDDGTTRFNINCIIHGSAP